MRKRKIKRHHHFAFSTLILISIILFLISGGIAWITGAFSDTSHICGNSICEVGESKIFCPEDCFGDCGDNICEGSEFLDCKIDCQDFSENNIQKQTQFSSGVWLIFLVSLIIVFAWFYKKK